jgi:MYXO-CTERM domain-containing protein
MRSTRALAPLLALAGMRIDGWLAPALGPHALARGYAELRHSLGDARQWLLTRGSAAAVVGAGAGESVSDGGTGNGDGPGLRGEEGDFVLHAFAALDRGSAALERWWRQQVAAGGGVDAGNIENAVMLGLLAALLVVLVLRRRRFAART